MSILHNQLALYGAIDDIVVRAKSRRKKSEDRIDQDRQIVDLVERWLPGTTGFGRAGWYREVQDFLGQLAEGSDSQLTFPSAKTALENIHAVAANGKKRHRSAADDAFEDRIDWYSPALDPVLARASFAAVVLKKILPPQNEGELSQDLRDTFRAVMENFTADHDPPRSASGADDMQETPSTRSAEDLTQILFDDVDDVDNRTDWVWRISPNGVAAPDVSELYAQTCTPCFGSVVNNRGRYCSVVTSTISSSKLRVVDIENVLDPRNWPLCSKFFVAMKPQSPDLLDRWSRIHEEVSAEPTKYHLSVDLLFYSERQTHGSIFINYDMDPKQADDCLVEVDSGYIWVTPFNKLNDPTVDGVLIRSSKQERINGVSASAMSALACVLGWADAGKDMFAGTAQKVREGEAHQLPYPFTPSGSAV